MQIRPEILSILVCPETKKRLVEADQSLIESLNASILSGTVKNRAGTPVTAPISAGLLEQDSKILYPIRDQIPALLVEEGIVLHE